MTPIEFIKIGQRLYGRKRWKSCLARDLGIDVSTVHRMTKRELVPGPYEVAMKAMLQNRIQQEKIEKEARKLLPRKLRKRSPRATLSRAQKIAARTRTACDKARKIAEKEEVL